MKKKSKYRGVSYVPKENAIRPWKAQMQFQKRTKHIGCFETEKEAALAYNKRAVRYLGIYAKINEVE